MMRFQRNVVVKVGFVAALCLLLGLVQSQFVLAQPAPQAGGAGAGARGFPGFGMQRADPRVENRTYRFTDTDEDMPYAVFVSSKVSKDKENPLIIALHGLGGSPTTLLTGNALELAEEGGYILVGPMGYSSSGWYGIPGMNFGGRGFGGGGNAPANAHELSEKDVMNVLDIVRKEFNVDESRIYLMGHSMGGAGAFNLGVKYASTWAAIGAMAPAAFTIQPTIFEKAKDLPVIIIQGDSDTLVPVTNTRRWVEKLKQLEMTYKYNEVPGGDHGSVMFGGMPDIFKFFAEHTKPTPDQDEVAEVPDSTTEATAEPVDETPEAENGTTETTSPPEETIPTANETTSRTVEDGGTGPYKAILVADSSLATHTIFRPKDLDPFGEGEKLPIFAWGNGACANSCQGYHNFLSEIASHGFLVVAIGPAQTAGGRGGGMMGMGGGMGMGGSTESSQLIDAIDWAIAQNSNEESLYFGKIDTSKIAVSGHSCGGLQAIEVSTDPRITTTVVCSSGIFTAGFRGGTRGGAGARGGAAPGARGGAGPGARSGADAGASAGPDAAALAGYGGMMGGGGGMMGGGGGMMGGGGGMMGGGMMMNLPSITKEYLAKLHAPMIYLLGGTSDMAYGNGMDDYRHIEKLPIFMASIDVGHGGTYSHPHGGEFAPVTVAWLKWQLKGDEEAGKMFTGDPCELSKSPGWTVEKKNIP